MTDVRENNQVTITGTVLCVPKLSHIVYAEQFYIFSLGVERLSDTRDVVNVLVSQRLFSEEFSLQVGACVTVQGQFRSYNNYSGTGSRLVLSVFAKDIVCAQPEGLKDPNRIFLDGFICKPPIYRMTPFGREIADVLLAVNRAYNKSDYIPVIAWGRNARFCRDLTVGTRIRVWGRIQSREYVKHIDADTSVTKIAYEVSVGKLEVVEQENA